MHGLIDVLPLDGDPRPIAGLLLHLIPSLWLKSSRGSHLFGSRAFFPWRPPSVHMLEHPFSAGTHAADSAMRAVSRRISQVARLAGPSGEVSLLTVGPQGLGRPCRPLTGSFPTRSVWTRPDVPAANPAFFSNRYSLQGNPTSKSYRAGPRSWPPPSRGLCEQGNCPVDAAQQAGAVVLKQPLNHPGLFMFLTCSHWSRPNPF